MAVNVGGILINAAMVLLIVVFAVIAIMLNSSLQTCEREQSPYCYTIQCPCDDASKSPCRGYALRPGPKPDTWYCSDAPLTLVDSSGNPA